MKPVQRYLLFFILFYFIHFVVLYASTLQSKSAPKLTALFSLMLGGYFLVSLFLSVQTQARAEAYLELGRLMSESDRYDIDADKDVMHAHLYGSVDEKYLIPSAERSLLCIEHTGYVAKDFSADPAPVIFTVETKNIFTKQSFRLVAQVCPK